MSVRKVIDALPTRHCNSPQSARILIRRSGLEYWKLTHGLISKLPFRASVCYQHFRKSVSASSDISSSSTSVLNCLLPLQNRYQG